MTTSFLAGIKHAHPTAEDPRIGRTTALVEANSFEQLAIWCEHAADGALERRVGHGKQCARVSWEQDNRGAWFKIGERDGDPICVDLTWATIGGHLVCFWFPTSQLVDFAMLHAWLRDTFPKNARRCDAMNFHNAFERWPA